MLSKIKASSAECILCYGDEARVGKMFEKDGVCICNSCIDKLQIWQGEQMPTFEGVPVNWTETEQAMKEAFVFGLGAMRIKNPVVFSAHEPEAKRWQLGRPLKAEDLEKAAIEIRSQSVFPQVNQVEMDFADSEPALLKEAKKSRMAYSDWLAAKYVDFMGNTVESEDE